MIPFIGRLSVNEWILLFLVYTEKICSFVVNTLIPSFFIHFLKSITNTTVSFVMSIFRSNVPTGRRIKEEEYIRRLAACNNIKETLQILSPDIELEEHLVVTDDKYMLTLHRIPPKNGVESKGIVYLHHGLLMCSDIWMCHHISPMTKNLPLLLHSLKNYDVWLGNNRGNKYSGYHLHHNITDTKFWDFSLDEFAYFDIPNSIDYILNYTKRDKISSVIAFSQGSAQTFGALSIKPDLNDKIENFIALAPAMTPPGLYNKLVDTLMKTSPHLIYLFFGKKILLSSANTIWKKTLPTEIFNRCIEMATKFLFNWNNYNIQRSKTLCFGNLYSPTSVKCVVHWFQILNAQRFQLYHDTTYLGSDSQRANLFQPLCFPTLTNIKIPVLLIYGGSDSLVDIEVMKKNLPKDLCFQVEIPDHEHLDIIWGDDCDRKVWPHVLKFMQFWNEEVPLLLDHPNHGSFTDSIVANVHEDRQRRGHAFREYQAQFNSDLANQALFSTPSSTPPTLSPRASISVKSVGEPEVVNPYSDQEEVAGEEYNHSDNSSTIVNSSVYTDLKSRMASISSD